MLNLFSFTFTRLANCFCIVCFFFFYYIIIKFDVFLVYNSSFFLFACLLVCLKRILIVSFLYLYIYTFFFKVKFLFLSKF